MGEKDVFAEVRIAQDTDASSETPARDGSKPGASCLALNGTSPGRVSVTRRPKRRATSKLKAVAPILGMESPPVASTRAGAVKTPELVSTLKPSGLETFVTVCPNLRSTPPPAHSCSSMATMARADPSQNN